MAIKRRHDEGEASVAATNEKVITDAVAEATAPVEVPEENSGILQSKSDTIAFVAAIGDPSRPDVTPNPQDPQHPRVDPTIVGFAFKASEDLEVPDCGTPANLKDNSMDYVAEMVNNTRHVAAGEVFYLTRFETGLLLSREEYNSIITGGELPVKVVYQKRKDNAVGGVATVSNLTPLPSVSLRPIDAGKSIKDIKMIECLSFTKEATEKGAAKKIRSLNPGFEKWESLAIVKSPARGASTATTKDRITRNKAASAFLDIVARKH